LKPAEFWDLHPLEFWWLVKARRPVRMYGSLTEHDMAELYELAFGEDRKE
jgi:hypothetical protein